MKTKNLIFLFLLFSAGTISAQVTVNYTYDNLNRLTQATYSNGAGIKYTYDELGNRTQESKTSSLSVQEVSPTKSFSIFPNPFVDELFIKSDTETIKSLVLFDGSGRVVKQVASINTMSYRLEAANLSQGMYILRIKTDTGEQTYKIIKK